MENYFVRRIKGLPAENLEDKECIEVVNALDSMLTETCGAYNAEGEADGHNRVRSRQIVAKAKSDTRWLLNLFISHIKGHIEAQTEKKRQRQVEVRAKENHLYELEEQRLFMEHQALVDNAFFNIFLAFIYIAAAIVLILADYAFSQKLFSDLFEQVTTAKPDFEGSFFDKVLAFITSPAHIFPLGIALTAFIAKIVYDELTSGLTLWKKNDFSRYQKDLNLKKIPTIDQEKQQNKKFFWYRAVTFLSKIIALGTLCILLVFWIKALTGMSDARHLAQQLNEEIHLQEVFFNAHEYQSEDSLIEAQKTAKINSFENNVTTLKNNKKDALKEPLKYFTVIFPIIAGICFSIGMKALYNIARRYVIIPLRVLRIQTELKNPNKKLRDAEINLRIFYVLEKMLCTINTNCEVEYTPNNDILSEFEKMLISYYVGGYNRKAVFDATTDLFDIAMHIRQKHATNSIDVIDDASYIDINFLNQPM